MASINMSSALATTQLNKFMGLHFGSVGQWQANPGITASNPLLCRGDYMSCRILIMKGTKPTAPLGTFAASVPDLLVEFRTYTYEISAVGGNPYTISSGFKTASQTGLATWFIIILDTASGGDPVNTNVIEQQVIGTVGVIGSGEDMVISNTSIVSGNQYRIYNLKLSIPESWTY